MARESVFDKQMDANARYRAGRRMMERLPCADSKRRTRLEKDTAAWLKWYLGQAYPLPFGQVHLDIIKGAEDAIATGGKFVVAAPRGTGKSTVLWGVALKFAVTQRVKFPALLPWKASDLRKALRFWKNALCFNARLLADYPEYCQPFGESKGSSMKCVTLTWADTGEPAGAELRLSDGMMIFPDGLGAIGSSTINGNPRGLNHSTEDGRVLRPDLVFIDDPQDKSVAKSPTQTASIIDVIDTDVMGMAGPDQRMPMLLSCTVMQVGDVATHYLAASDWTAVKVGQIVKWPDDMGAWKEFGVMIGEKREKDALAYYKANKEKLTKGMEVSWAHRFDKTRKEPDAFYSAMRDFYFMGESAFMAERQNEPVTVTTSQYTLTPALVASRVNGYPRLTAPQGIDWIVAGADVNYIGINWTILAATRTGIIYCVAYGCYTAGKAMLFDPKREPKQAEAAAIHNGCLAWMREISALSVTVGDKVQHVALGGIDCGNWSDIIIPAIYSVRLPVQFLPVRGVQAIKYRVQKDALRAGDGWHVATWRQGKVLVLNADMQRETVQRAFLAEPGTAGSISLYATDRKHEHAAFSEEICGENLAEHVQTPTSDFYKWTHRPGARWDKLDALAYARALLGASGLSTSGLAPVVNRRPRRRATGCTVIPI